MRKIVSGYEKGRVKRRNQFIVGGILVFIMISSILGYSFQGRISNNAGDNSNSSNIKSVDYNGLTFKQQGNFWGLDYNGENFIFKYTPQQINETVNTSRTMADFYGKVLYVYSEDTNAESEIRNNMVGFVSSIKNACPQGGTCLENYPEKDCAENFIILKQGNNSGISEDNKCIFITGNNLSELSDEFLFKVLKII